jgi:hypothetical protein
VLTEAKVALNAADPDSWNVEQFDEDGSCPVLWRKRHKPLGCGVCM